MAKDKTASSEKKRKKPAAKAKGGKKTKAKTATSGYEALAKLAEHPLVIDLIAIGATAAVAALAGRGTRGKAGTGKSKSSTGAVKAAGKAAATAVGKRLMDEYTAVKDVAAAKKKAKV